MEKTRLYVKLNDHVEVKVYELTFIGFGYISSDPTRVEPTTLLFDF